MQIQEVAEDAVDSAPRKMRRAVRELIGGGPLTRVSCSDARFWYPWHFHPEVEVKLVLSGQGTRYVGESIEPFEAGDFCIIGPDTPHCWSSRPVRGRWVQARVVQFHPDIFGADLAARPGFDTIAGLLDRARRGLALSGQTRTDATRELTGVFEATTTARQLAHILTLLAIVAESTDVRCLCATATGRHRDTANARLSAQIVEYLQAHACEPLTASAVAAHFEMSPSGFSHFFRREFDKTFGCYLAEIRVGAASHLLVEQELSMSELATRCGFGTVAGLNRHFRAVRGTTPTAYRRIARQMNHR